jgi:uncharacterized protein YkwD
MRAQKLKSRIVLLWGLVVSLLFLSTIHRVHTAPRSFLAPTSPHAVYLPLVTHLPATAETPIPPDDLAVEQFIASQINAQRQAAGLPPLVLDAALTQAARRHCRDMAEQGFTDHTGSDGSSPGERVQDAGYGGTYAGETIGWGSWDSSNIVDWWMSSPPHRALILSTWATDFGVSYVRDPESDWGQYWTVNFGRRSSSAVEAVCTTRLPPSVNLW